MSCTKTAENHQEVENLRTNILTLEEKNKIVMLLKTYDKALPKYEIYRVENGKEIKIGENNKTRFDFDFIPKSVKDNSPEIFITFKYNGKTLVSCTFNVRGRRINYC